jgi:glycogen debranching enzyme
MALAKSDARQYSQFRSRKRDHDGSIHAHQSLGAGSNETWMDGKLGDAICSPRGNRAFEIQGLWFFALKRWAQLADHLRAEGTLDFTAKPNALLVFQLDTQDLLLAAQEKQVM